MNSARKGITTLAALRTVARNALDAAVPRKSA
jgi:hypothetical protein